LAVILFVSEKAWQKLNDNINFIMGFVQGMGTNVIQISTNIEKGLKTMGALEDQIAALQTSVTNLQVAVTAAAQEISTLAAEIKANPADTAAVQSAAAQIQAAADNLNQAVAAAQAPPPASGS
jgi:peptidoglycan hydrolase CwlO-like protein